MRSRFFGAVVIIILGFSSFVHSANDNPYIVVQKVTDDLFERMKAEGIADKQNPELLKTIVREELIPHTDYRFAAFKVLGNNFRGVPKDKLLEYTEVFNEYLVVNYASILGEYTNQRFEFEPMRENHDKGMASVRGVIKGGVGPDIDIVFKVRKNPKTNQWQAYDLVAEGISMVSSKRSQYAPIIRRQGLDSMMMQMRKVIESEELVEVIDAVSAE